MRAAITIPARPEYMRAALRGLTAVNRIVLSERQLPPLYKSGVRYQEETLGREEWQSADQVYSKGQGDCEDLACWRAAELNLSGDPLAYADVVKSGVRRFHAIVRRGDGTTEDPTALLLGRW